MLPNLGIEVHESNAMPIQLQQLQPKKRTLKTYVDEEKISQNFTVLTYNVWVHEAYQKERLLKIINIVRTKMPDILCLQELTTESFPFVEARLSPFYHIFQAFITAGNSYGDCIMYRKDTVKMVEDNDNPYYYDYDGATKMHRRVIGCEFELVKFGPSAPRIHLLTTHLESAPTNDNYRSLQFDIIQRAIGSLKNVILAGDFNISTQKQREEEIERKIDRSRLKDCWVELGCPYKVKHTYNPKRNAIMQGQDDSLMHGSQPQRFDRVLYYSAGQHFKPCLMSLVGRENVSQSVPIPPSNHYGVIVEFELTNE